MNQGATTLRELMSQPRSWRDLLDRLAQQGDSLPLDLAGFDEVILFGSGSSYYLAMGLAWLVEQQLGVRVRALPSCELVLTPGSYLDGPATKAAVGISRSGESTEVLLVADALKTREIPLLAVTCEPSSSLARRSDHVLIAHEGREDGLVMLRSFTSMFLGLQRFIALRGGGQVAGLDRLPDLGTRLLAEHRQPLAELVRRRDLGRFVFLGSGVTYPFTREAALKIQEMAITTSEAYHSLEYRHGPKSTAGEGTLITYFSLEGDERFGPDLIRDMKAQGAATLVIGEETSGYQEHADLRIDLRSGLSPEERLLLYLLPVQLLAFEVAMKNGKDPDVSQNLSSVVLL